MKRVMCDLCVCLTHFHCEKLYEKTDSKNVFMHAHNGAWACNVEYGLSTVKGAYV